MIVSEDHIKILKALIYILPQDYYSVSVEEALEIAVKLLENSNGLIVEELEKIKSEIKEYYWLLDTCGNVITQNNVEAIIEDHISKLKGEQE